MSRHSKNTCTRQFYSYHEKQKAGVGSISQRLGSESQLPFGYCGLSMYPAEDPVVSPSGHIYSKESMLEYLLTKSKELKESQRLYDEQQKRLENTEKKKVESEKKSREESFKEVNADGIILGKRKESQDIQSNNEEYHAYRRKVIDDREKDIKLEELKKVSPWIPQFIPEAERSTLTEPPKRPSSPFTGRPLRAKDLIPITLHREVSDKSETIKFLCPVSRKTITNQKVYLIKKTGTIMIEQAAKELAFPSMTCPLTGKPFKQEDLIEIVQAASGFAATGKVEAKKHRPSLN